MASHNKTWYIGDLKLGSHSDAEMRGYSDVKEYNDMVINSINSTISEKDELFIIGSVLYNSCDYTLLRKIKGIKHIIQGISDTDVRMHRMSGFMAKFYPYKDYRMPKFIVSAMPIHPNSLDTYAINLYGCSPVIPIDDVRYLNVSADIHNYKPISYDEIIQYMKDNNLFDGKFFSRHTSKRFSNGE